MQKMAVGLFDPLDEQGWGHITGADLNSSHAQQVAYEAALQSFVLLKNDGAALPFTAGLKLAVVGPMATDASLYKSDYAGGGLPPGQPSIADALRAASNELAIAGDAAEETTVSGVSESRVVCMSNL